MKILYGINGTGNGHITKSLEVISQLEKEGHEVDILISGSNKNLDINHEVKFQKKGFSFEYKNGSIDFYSTLKSSNIRQFIKDLKLDINSYDKIVTDFEPITAWASKLNDKKIIGISHQYAFKSKKCPRPDNISRISEFFLSNYAPVDLPIGLHFEKYDNFIYHPIIRRDIQTAFIQNLGHICVYLPGYSLNDIVTFFSKFNRTFEIFSNSADELRFKNVNVFPLSLKEFTRSLVTCDTVVTAAGFETPSEALYLGKKLIVIPLKKQYEQECNAASLSKMGIRVEKNLQDLRTIECEPINWEWDNPLNKITSKITSL